MASDGHIGKIDIQVAWKNQRIGVKSETIDLAKLAFSSAIDSQKLLDDPKVKAKIGSELDVIIRDKPVRAHIVKTPFYQSRYKK